MKSLRFHAAIQKVMFHELTWLDCYIAEMEVVKKSTGIDAYLYKEISDEFNMDFAQNFPFIFEDMYI